MFKSFAEWPENVYTNEFGTHISSDTHSNEDQAKGVCRFLESFGFAGVGKNFPLKTWVEKFDSSQQTKVQICHECEGLGYTEPTLQDPDGLCQKCRGNGKL